MITGTIRYATTKGLQTGAERFLLDQYEDGGLSFTATCRMDERALARVSTLSLAVDGTPRDATSRVSVDGKVIGAGSYVFHPDRLDYAVWHDDAPTLVTASMPLVTPARYIGLHPLVGDGLAAGLWRQDGPARQTVPGCVTTAHEPDGAGDQCPVAFDMTVEMLGAESLSVPAGRFKANTFALSWRPDWPDATLWVRARDGLFLRLTWETLDAVYELVEVSTA